MAQQTQVTRTPKGVVAPSHAAAPAPVEARPVQDTVDEIKQALGQILVIYGDQKEYFDVAGESVSSIRSQLEDAWGIEKASTPQINGEDAKETTILQQHQELEFVKELGQKG